MLVKRSFSFELITHILKFSKMVFYAIVARLDPAQSRIQVARFCFLSKNALKKTEKSEITATCGLLCAGSRRATIA